MDAGGAKASEVGELKYRPVTFPNGGALKHQHAPARSAATVYRECLKNHAAGIGGYALDGCGEFMPSPDATPSEPTSLRCAACGCHRNFHRRVADGPLHRPPPPPPPPSRPDELPSAARDDDDDDDDDEDEEDDDEEDDEEETHQPLMYFPSAPHMLLALSSGGGSSDPARHPPPFASHPPPPRHPPPTTAAAASRKRFRTKFSPEQKQRMQELSERLGWRLQRRDEAVVDECCREIGVGKGVFKVWMHNNKHTFLGTGRRGAPHHAAPTAAVAAPGVDDKAGVVPGGEHSADGDGAAAGGSRT